MRNSVLEEFRLRTSGRKSVAERFENLHKGAWFRESEEMSVERDGIYHEK